MFPVSDFLIYCFVTAYMPGANNLLSMSNAARLGFRKSFRFNLGITAGFLIVMSVCTFFCSTLYAILPNRKNLYADFWRRLYALSRIESLENFFRSESRKQNRIKFFCGNDIAVHESQNLYLCDHSYVPLHTACISFCNGIGRIYCRLDNDRSSGSYVWALFSSAFCKIFAKHTRAVNLIMAFLLVYCAISLFL